MHNHKTAFVICLALIASIVIGMFIFVYMYKHEAKTIKNSERISL